MGPVAYAFRGVVHGRVRSLVVLALLFALLAGSAAAAVTAARATDTAYPRWLALADAPALDLDLDPRLDTPEFLAAVEAIPGIARVSRAAAVAVARIEDGEFGSLPVLASLDGRRFYTSDRIRVLDGRMPDPAAEHEVLVNRTFSEQEGVGPGDVLQYHRMTTEEVMANFSEGVPLRGVPIELTVTGIGILPTEIVVDELAELATVVGTPALAARDDVGRLWSRSGLHLAEGAAVQSVRDALYELGRRHGGEATVESREVIADRTRRAVRPFVLGLGLLGVFAAALAALLVGQAMARHVLVSGASTPTLRALGLSRGGQVATLLLGPALATVGGVAGAFVVAAALSTLGSAGPVRAVDPATGVRPDLLVLLPVTFGLAAAVLGWTATTAWRLVRTGAAPAVLRRPGRLAEVVRASGAPIPAVIGADWALDRSRPSPARMTLVLTAVAVIGLSAAVTFHDSLSGLADRPRLYGWAWDAVIISEAGYGPVDYAAVIDHPDVETVTAVVYGPLLVDGVEVQGQGMVPLVGSVLPPFSAGGPPGGLDEIAIGAVTLDRLGKAIGDTVTVLLPGEGEELELTVTGTPVLPAVGRADVDRAGLGVGAMMLLPEEFLDDGSAGMALVTFAGSDPAGSLRRIEADLGEGRPQIEVLPVIRPADIRSLGALGPAPWVIVALLAAALVVTLLHGVLIGVSRHRRSLSVLGALGMGPGQRRRIAHWQASVTAVVSLLVGLPIGIAVGRLAWQELASAIGVIPEAVVPMTGFVAVAAVVILLANLAAAVPAQRAARVQPARVLRAE